MAEHDPDPRNELLSELESIKGLLDEQDPEAMPDPDEIPVLREVIESIEPLSEDKPHQPPLFPETGPAPQGGKRQTQAKGENPFLPPHIRARLQGNRPTQPQQATEPPATTIEDAANAPAGQTATTRTTAQRAALIEALIDEFRPQMQARLKARLEAMTDEQLEALRS